MINTVIIFVVYHILRLESYSFFVGVATKHFDFAEEWAWDQVVIGDLGIENGVLVRGIAGVLDALVHDVVDDDGAAFGRDQHVASPVLRVILVQEKVHVVWHLLAANPQYSLDLFICRLEFV